MQDRSNGRETKMKPIFILIWFLSLVQNVRMAVLKRERIKSLTTVNRNGSISLVHLNTHKSEIRKAFNGLQQIAKQSKLTTTNVNNPPVDNKHSYIPADRSYSNLPDASRNKNADNPPVSYTKVFTKTPFTLNQEEDPNIMGEESKSSNTQPSAWRGGGRGGQNGGRGRGRGGRGRGRFHHRGGRGGGSGNSQENTSSKFNGNIPEKVTCLM